MLSIRAESYPSSFIENIDLNILQSLEISIFPGKLAFFKIFIYSLVLFFL